MNTAKRHHHPQPGGSCVVICPFPRPALADLIATGFPMPLDGLERDLAYTELKSMRWVMERQGIAFTERYEDFCRRIADELGV